MDKKRRAGVVGLFKAESSRVVQGYKTVDRTRLQAASVKEDFVKVQAIKPQPKVLALAGVPVIAYNEFQSRIFMIN